MRTGSMPEVIDLIGRGERIRTSDHLHPIQVRYQAALHPESAHDSRYSPRKSKFGWVAPGGDIELR